MTPTADGQVSLVTLTATQWANLVEALSSGDEEPADLSDTAERMATGAAVMRQVRATIATMSTAEVVARLAAADVPCAPVLPLAEVWAHDQVAASGAVLAFDHDVLGAVRQARPAPLFDGSPSPASKAAPRLGADTDDVLTAAGWSKQDVARLRDDGVIG